MQKDGVEKKRVFIISLKRKYRKLKRIIRGVRWGEIKNKKTRKLSNVKLCHAASSPRFLFLLAKKRKFINWQWSDCFSLSFRWKRNSLSWTRIVCFIFYKTDLNSFKWGVRHCGVSSRRISWIRTRWRVLCVEQCEGKVCIQYVPKVQGRCSLRMYMKVDIEEEPMSETSILWC